MFLRNRHLTGDVFHVVPWARGRDAESKFVQIANRFGAKNHVHHRQKRECFYIHREQYSIRL